MQIARLAFADQPVNWPDLEDWTIAAKTFSSKFGVNRPPPYPPPPPASLEAPEDDYSNYLEYYSSYSYDENGGYTYDYDYDGEPPSVAPLYSPSPPRSTPPDRRRVLQSNGESQQLDRRAGVGMRHAGYNVARASATTGQQLDDKSSGVLEGEEEYFFDDEFDDDLEGLPGGERRRLMSAAKKLSAKKRYAIFQQLAQRNVSGFAGYLVISSELARLDPTSTSAVFSMTISAKSDNPYPYGVVNQRRVSLEIPTNVSLSVNVLSAESGRIELRPGDVSASKRIDIDTQVIQVWAAELMLPDDAASLCLNRCSHSVLYSAVT
eukprot:363065-Chlamydomonas_euryale.AAC.2